MRRFVNEALREVSLLEEHITDWMAESPDPIESDPDGPLTDRQRVLVFAGCIKGTLEAGVTSTETTGTDHSADLAAAVAHVRDLAAQLVEATRSADRLSDDRDALRAKLAEAESDLSMVQAALNRQTDFAEKAIRDRVEAESRLTRYAALEKAAREWRNGLIYTTGDTARALVEAVDALTPAASKARYAPCDDCCYDDGEVGCINADGDPANAACEAYKQGVVPAPAAKPATCGDKPSSFDESMDRHCEDCRYYEHSIKAEPCLGCYKIGSRPNFTRRLPVVSDARPAAESKEAAK